jgi:hypothetical protein
VALRFDRNASGRHGRRDRRNGRQRQHRQRRHRRQRQHGQRGHRRRRELLAAVDLGNLGSVTSPSAELSNTNSSSLLTWYHPTGV